MLSDGLVEAKVFSSIFRISEEEHPIIEPHLPPIMGRCLNLEIIDGVLTRNLVIFTFGFLLITSAMILPSTLALNVTPQRFDCSCEKVKL
jgi:hypothetical protein